MEYVYVTDNNLEDKQKYNYSQYGGEEFLDAYITSRENAIKSIEACYCIHQTYTELKEISENFNDDEIVTLEIKELMDSYVKNFEVRKRLYQAYDEYWKPVSDKYEDFNCYILFAKTLEQMYEKTKNLKYLSCLMKVDDTLISLVHVMPMSCNQELSIVLTKEIELYNACIKSAVED